MAFYLTDFRELEEQSRWMKYDHDFIAASGGAYATLLEFREPVDLVLRAPNVPRAAWSRGVDGRRGIVLSREIHMSDDAAALPCCGSHCGPIHG